MRTILLIAARSLLSHRQRSLLLGGAMVLVTSLLVLLQGVSAGMQSAMLDAATTLSTGHINVAGFYKLTAGTGAPLVTDYARLEKLVLDNIPEAELVVDRGRGWGKIVSPSSSFQVGVNGIDITREPGLLEVLRPAPRSAYVDGAGDETVGDVRELAQPGTVLLFVEQAKRLGVDVGDVLTLTLTTSANRNNTMDLRVVAVCRDIGFLSNWSVFMPMTSLRQAFQLPDTATGAIHIILRDVGDLPRVVERLRGLIEDAGYRLMEPERAPFWMKFETVSSEDWVGQKIDITTWEDEMAFLDWILAAFSAVTVMLVGILMVMIIIGIMNTLWIAIRERTREIGTLRAIGMGRGAVLLMFLLEALLLSLASTVVGALLAGLLAGVINAADIPISSDALRMFMMSDFVRLDVSAASVVGSVVVITLASTLGALYPAYRAARMRPITAIHHVG